MVTGCFSTPAWSGDAALGSGDGGVDSDSAMPANLMFLTHGMTVGNTITTIVAADKFCQDSAGIAGKSGTYRAWVSFAGVSAQSRIAGSRGWVRVDGEPFADRIEDIVAGHMFAPPRIDENGNDAFSLFTYVLTGTNALGNPSGSDCAISAVGTIGFADAAAPLWTESATLSCSTNFQLYCFGVGAVTAVTPTPRTEPIAFVSNSVSVTALGGLDDQCNMDAAAQGLPGTYGAFVATTAQSALDRVSTGGTHTWNRVDGVPVARTGVSTLLAPIDVDASGTHVGGEVWFGSMFANDKASSSSANCTDWSSTSGTTSTGDSLRSSIGAFSGASQLSCGFSRRVYCFEMI